MSNLTDILANNDPGEPMSRVVGRLVEILGARLCAVIGDVKQTSIVREWIDGKEPAVGRSRILRFALRVAEAIERRYESSRLVLVCRAVARHLGKPSLQAWPLVSHDTAGL